MPQISGIHAMSKTMIRLLLTASIGLAGVLHAGVTLAEEPAKKTKPVKTAKKAKAAPAPVPLADLSAEQLVNAERVLTGPQECEFNQTIAVESASEKAGYFTISHKGKKYLLAPEPTTTGAVRLEDKKAGVVWLQIANKSMLMNSRIGQRMVDECVHPTQKV
jgi:hypothetical protein